jgi:hypothetical protein
VSASVASLGEVGVEAPACDGSHRTHHTAII